MLSQTIKTHIGKLQQKKYRKEFAEFLVEGVKGVEEALQYATVLVIVIEGGRRDEPEFQQIILRAGVLDVRVEFCGRQDIDAIKTTETYPGISAIVEMPSVDRDEVNESERILVLDQVKDPGNLGTIIRTADWFGIDTVLLSEDSCDPYNEKCVRATMGSIFRVRVDQVVDMKARLEELKEEGYTLSCFTMNGKPLTKMIGGTKQVYLFGSESHGLRTELEALCDAAYTIPGNTKAESLNVGVAVGIVLWQTKQ